MLTLRDAARREFTTTGFVASHEEIRTGALQRIADATEKMAASYDALRNDRDWWKEVATRRAEEADRRARSNAALRGVITRLKKRLAR